MYTIDTIDSIEKFRALKDIWNAALAKSTMDMPFMTHEWFSCWWSVYGGGNTLMILVVREKGEIVAIAPFMKTQVHLCGFPASAITFIDEQHAGRMGIIFVKQDHALMGEILRFLGKNAPLHSLLLFTGVEKGSLTDLYLKPLLMADYPLYKEIPHELSPFVSVKGSWESFLSHKSKPFRLKLNHQRNVLHRQGTCEIETFTHERIEKAIDEVLFIERRSWKYRNHSAIAGNNRKTEFYGAIAREFAQKRWLMLSLLKLEGRPIAYLFNLAYKNRIYGLKSGYDIRYHKFSPGKYLLQHYVKYCFDNRYIEYDMLGRNEPYKMEWATECRTHSKYMIFNRTFYARALHSVVTKIVPRMRNLFSTASLTKS